jgi:uncharacterized protein YdhG (YjbR/CyaY superfamily)
MLKPDKKIPTSIDEYIAEFPESTQKILQELRRVIKLNAPGAIEKISYQMPAFDLKGILVYFAGYKNHIGFYPCASGIANFKEEISAYKNAKGSVQFPIDKPLPFDLIAEIVKFRVIENLEKAELKLRKKN